MRSVFLARPMRLQIKKKWLHVHKSREESNLNINEKIIGLNVESKYTKVMQRDCKNYYLTLKNAYHSGLKHKNWTIRILPVRPALEAVRDAAW